MPTTTNANCTQCDPQPSPVGAGVVGAFEGAHYYHCDAFRPEFNCRMRGLNNPFCAACTGRIRQMLQPYASPWNHSDLTQATGASDAARDPAGYTWDVDSTQHVVYRGTDRHIHELWFSLPHVAFEPYSYRNLASCRGA